MFIAISATVSFSSYAAEGHDNGSELEEHFDPLFWHPTPDNPQLPLPYLPTREEMAAQRPETPPILPPLSLEDREGQNRKEEQRQKRRQDKEPLDELQHKRTRLTPNEQQSTLSTISSSSSRST